MFPKEVISLTKPYEEIQYVAEPELNEVSRLYAEWLLAEKAKKLKGKYGGQCVVFARNFVKSAPGTIKGMAKNVPTNSDIPTVGAIIKTNESKYGHLAVVIAINNGTLTLIESNYNWNQRIGIREISVTDSRIKGYIIN